MSKSIPLSQILKLYNKGMSAKVVADHFGVSRQAISDRLKKAGVRTRPVQPYVSYPDKKLIEQLYLDEKLTIRKTAERLNESHDRIDRAIDVYGIKRRSYSPREITFPKLKELAVGQSIELPRKNWPRPQSRYYAMAKVIGIRVSVRTIDAQTLRVTRIK